MIVSYPPYAMTRLRFTLHVKLHFRLHHDLHHFTSLRARIGNDELPVVVDKLRQLSRQLERFEVVTSPIRLHHELHLCSSRAASMLITSLCMDIARCSCAHPGLYLCSSPFASVSLMNLRLPISCGALLCA